MERIGIEDNFFELGGDSILSIQVVARARQQGMQMTPRQLFQQQTIAELAAVVQDLNQMGAPIEQGLAQGNAPYQVAPVGGYTPAAFPLARLSQEQLDGLVEHLPAFEQIYLLTPLQQGLLFQSLYAPNSGDYVTQIRFTLQGTLNEIALLHAWQEVLQRHAILRTSFIWEDLDQPHQVVSRQGVLPHIQLDISALQSQEQEACLQTFVQHDREHEFVLTEAPLMRLALIRLTQERYECVWTHHHLLLDGWSLPIVLKDVFALYQSLLQNQPVQWAAPRSYSDYLAWLLQQDGQQAEAYWRRTLAGVTGPSQLQIEQEVAPDQQRGAERAEIEIFLSQTLSQQLQQFARREHLTLNTLALGAWMLVLSRYSGQRDVLCGAVVAGRPAEIAGIEEMVGLFINTVPVRVQVSPEQRVLSWLQEVQEQQSEQRQYEYSSLTQVQNWSPLPAGTALFDCLFVFENYPLGAVAEEEASTVHVEAWQIQQQIHYPLTLFVAPGAQLGLKLHYDRNRFAAPQIQQIVIHLQRVLESFLASAEQPLGVIELLSARERVMLVQQWQPEAAVSGTQTTIPQLFEAQVRLHSEAIAVLSEHGQLSYGELNRRANQLAHLLQERGVGPEVLVGLCLPRSPELLISLLGILKAGGAYVPLDPSYPPERLRFQMQDAHVTAVVTSRAVHEALALAADQALVLETLWPKLNTQSSKDLVGTDWSERLAYVIYTSGSTGVPKGVAISHRSALRLLHWARDCFGSALEKQVLASTSICFDLSIYELLGPLSWGGQVVLVENALHWPEQESAQGVYLVNTVPSAMQELVRSQRVPPSVRVVNLAGEALSRQLVDQLYASEALEAVYNLYGPSEDTTYSTWARLEREEVGAVPIGRAVKGTQAYVLDADLQLVPVGVMGELYLGGAGLARGYLGQPAQTAERFVPDAFGERADGRLYRTGDLARWRDDGQLDYLGRRDSQVKVRGYRIELGEIEQALREQDSVHEVVVVVVEQERRSKRLVAYLVPKEAEKFRWKQVRETLAGRLPDYMLPALCVQLEKLPLTPNGKVDRRALPLPEEAYLSHEKEYTAPRTEMEASLAEVWRQVLGVQKIGVHDNFFALGGDSILSIQIISRARQSGLQLTPRQLFQQQTIAELARVVQLVNQSVVLAEVGPVTGEAPLTPIQHWFFEQEQTDPWYWNQSVLLQPRSLLDVHILEDALRAVLESHDSLRLRFQQSEEGWKQAYGEQKKMPIVQVDLGAVLKQERMNVLEALATTMQASLNLAQGPMFRVILFNLGAASGQRLLFVCHHLVVDGVSWRILLQDLEHAYKQAERGVQIQLPLKTSSWQQWTRALDSYAQAESIVKQLAFWQRQHERVVAALPLDNRQGENTVASIGLVEVSLSEEETSALLHEVPQAYHTQINDVLLTGLVQALQRWTGAGSWRVVLEGHGREPIHEELDLSRTIGWFTTLSPVVLELPLGAEEDAGQALKAIKEQLRAIPEHGLGYGLLRYLCRWPEVIEQRASWLKGPLAEISFNYLGQTDQAIAESQLLQPALESSGLSVKQESYRQHLLEISGRISEGRLVLNWMYSQNCHRQEAIATLAQNYLRALQKIILHCRTQKTEEYTPSDFPKAQLSQKNLDKFITKIKKKKAD